MIKKKTLIYLGLLLIILIVIVLNIKKTMYSFEYPEKIPKDFNFIAKITSGKYSINTYNNTFSKSINWDKDTVLYYKINDNEKRRIYDLIKEYNIIRYPNYFTPPTHRRIMPSFDYYFKCTFDSINVEINWEYNTESEEKKAQQLRDFLFQIFENILEEERIKNLPKTERISM